MKRDVKGFLKDLRKKNCNLKFKKTGEIIIKATEKPIRVLHVLTSIDSAGGVQNVIMNIYRNIDKKKVQFDFAVYNSNSNSFQKEIESYGGQVYFIGSPRKTGLFAFLSNYIRVIEKGKYNVVHAHTGWHSNLLSKIARLFKVEKVISHAHEISRHKLFSLSSLKRILINNKFFIKNIHLIACSEEVGLSSFNKKSHFQILNNGIPYSDYTWGMKDTSLREKFDIPRNAFIIGHIGRFHPVKNQEFLVPVIKEIKKTRKNVIIIFVGDGPTFLDIKEKFSSEGLNTNVRFLGSRTDIINILPVINVLTLPSHREGLGLVALEAQAAGVPCVASTNVPKKVDVGLNLVRFLSLNESPKLWGSEILKHSQNRVSEEEIIRKRFKESPFSIEKTIESIYKLYNIK